MLLKSYPIQISIIEENENIVKFKIVNQPEKWRYTINSSRTIYEPQNREEVYIKSTAFPEFSPNTSTLYIRGSDRHLDDDILSCTSYNFKRILNSLSKLKNGNNNKLTY